MAAPLSGDPPQLTDINWRIVSGTDFKKITWRREQPLSEESPVHGSTVQTGILQTEVKKESSHPGISDLHKILSPRRFHAATSQTLLNVRKRLGHLSKIPGPAVIEAIALSRAVSIILNFVFPNGRSLKGKSQALKFTWRLETVLEGSRQSMSALHSLLRSSRKPRFSKRDVIEFTARYDGREWQIDAIDFDAALSLWLSAYPKRLLGASNSVDKHPTDWLSGISQSKVRHRRILGDTSPPLKNEASETQGEKASTRYIGLGEETRTNTVLRDLSCWTNDPRVRELSENLMSTGPNDFPTKEEGHGIDLDLIVGFTGLLNSDGQGSDSSDNMQRKGMRATPPDHHDHGMPLFVHATGSLPSILSYHIFSAFMWAISPHINPYVFSRSTVEDAEQFHVGEFSSTWSLPTLRNGPLNKLVHDVSETELLTGEDVLLCAIPPFSSRGLLHNDSMLSLLIERARDFEVEHNWSQAKEIYLSLLQLDLDPRRLDRFCYSVVVEILEFLFLMLDAVHDGGFHQSSDDPNLEPEPRSLMNTVNDIIDALQARRILVTAIERLGYLYEQQKRDGRFHHVLERLHEVSKSFLRLCKAHCVNKGICELQRYIKRGEETVPSVMQIPHTDLQLKSLLGFSRVHEYACDGFERWVSPLDLENNESAGQADVFGWTPLHYAAVFLNDDPFMSLLKMARKDAISQHKLCDRSGKTPLHYAATCDDERLQVLIDNKDIARIATNIKHVTGQRPFTAQCDMDS